MTNNNVYYQRDANFAIIPIIHDVDAKKLLHHIAQLKKMYTNDNSHSFFWKFDVKNNSIVIDETSASISSDIQEQLSLIATWIFERGYHMKGHFILKINKLIKYFHMDGQRKSIDNLELFDDAKYIDNENIIMYDAKNKIDAYLNKDIISDKAVTCEIDISWIEDDKEYRTVFSKKNTCSLKQHLCSPIKFFIRNFSALVTMITVSYLVHVYVNDRYAKE